jgi:uncharacterized protein
MKLLLWGAICFAIVMWLLRTKKVSGTPGGSAHNSAESKHGNAEPMIRCVHCGVHIPLSEAVISRSNAAFCSEEHRLQHSAD